MSSMQNNRGTGGAGPGAAPAKERVTDDDDGRGENSAGGESVAGGPNFGSARSDYGSHAYGGRLDETGSESGGAAGYTREEETFEGDTGRQTSGGGLGLSTVLTLLAGVGIGAALMYALDPDQGRRRRALARDKLVSASNTTGKVIGSTARGLRNRAQGVIHETGKKLGLGGTRGAAEPEGQQQSGRQFEGQPTGDQA